MNKLNNYFEAKDFSFFVPSLLEDKEIQNLIKKELSHLDLEKEIKSKEISGEIINLLETHIFDNAIEIDIITVDLNEEQEDDPEYEPEYNCYTYVIRGMKGVYITESGDDDTRLFDSYEKAIESIELNYDVDLDQNNQVTKKSLEERMSFDQAVYKVLNIIKK